MEKKLSIAIDGPSAAGKSTIAKQIAKKYGYTYIDTGAMYRCVALYTKQTGLDWHNETEIENCLDEIDLYLNEEDEVYLNGEDVSEDIRQNDISLGASLVSRYAQVREHMVSLQRKMAEAGGVVIDGRDIGTVVLPHADLKIYQTASVEARALRRHLENIEKHRPSDLETIKKEIEQRDYEDTHRSVSPLKKAEDAYELDTSNLSIDQVIQVISEWIDKTLNEVKTC